MTSNGLTHTLLSLFRQIYDAPIFSIFKRECKKQDLEPFASSFFDSKMGLVLKRCCLSLHPDKLKHAFTDDHRDAMQVVCEVKGWWDEHALQLANDHQAQMVAWEDLCLQCPTTHYGQLVPLPPASKKRKTKLPFTGGKRKRARTGRSRDYKENFLYYKQAWFKKIGEDPSHDFDEGWAEAIYNRWVHEYYNDSLGEFDSLLMPKFRKLTNAIETRINNLTSQRNRILGLRTGHPQVNLVMLS